MVNSSGRSRVNRSACSSVAVTASAPPPRAGAPAALEPEVRTRACGPRWRRAVTVPLQTASLIAAAVRPPTYSGSAVSSVCASWMVPAPRPRLMHCPTNAWLITAGSVAGDAGSAPCWRPARRAGSRPGSSSAAAHPTVPRRPRRRRSASSSMLVSVSSVSSRPIASVRSPDRDGQIRHAEPGRPDRHGAGQPPAVGERHRVGADRGGDRGPGRRRSRRRACAVAWPPTGGRACSGTGPRTAPHTSVTARPCSASSAAVSMPVGPAADHGHRCAVMQRRSSAARSRLACSRSAMG